MPPLASDFGERGVVRRGFQPLSVGDKAPARVRAGFERLKRLAKQGSVEIKNPRRQKHAA